MNLYKAIITTGILDEFIAHATPETPTPVLYAWVKRHPALAAVTIEWPNDIRDIRRKLNCPAKQGCKRPPPARTGYTIRNDKGRRAAA